MALSLDEMKAITRRFVIEPWSHGNLSVLDEICAPNYTLGDTDLQGLKDAIAGYRDVMPDLTAEIKEMIAEDDQVAFGWVMHGTHAPTGKAIEFTGITIVRFSDGKIVHDQFQSSSPSLEDQIS